MKTTNEYKQKMLADKVLVIACLSAVLGLTACQQEGSAEKAGQKIDKAAENAQQKIELATERADQKIEAAKELLDQKAGSAGQYVDQSTAASKAALEKAGEKIDRAAENAEQKIEQATEQSGQQLENAKESVIDTAVTAGEYVDDSVTTMKVKAAILNEAMLKASQIEVTTVNGVVQLSGTVDSEQSIGKAMEVANSQPNVKAVQTALIVKSPGK